MRWEKLAEFEYWRENPCYFAVECGTIMEKDFWRCTEVKPANYEEYLQEPKSLDWKTMISIHEDMLKEIGTDPDAEELYEELSKAAAKYIHFRSNWFLWSREERAAQDESRTASHNSLIVKFNMLARYLKMQGKEASWSFLYNTNIGNSRKGG